MSGHQFTEMDEEALLRDVDGRTDDTLENDEAILGEDEFDIEDDDDLNAKILDEAGKVAQARSVPSAIPKKDTQETLTKPDQRQKITFGEKEAAVVNLKQSNPAAADARQKRQQRFGTVLPDTSADAKLKRAERFGVKNEETAKLARLARFGVVKTSASPTVTKTPATRGRTRGRGRGGKFGAFNLSVMETTKQKSIVTRELIKGQDEKKKQRAQRFQGASSSSSASSGPGVDDERKKARAQRFGLT